MAEMKAAAKRMIAREVGGEAVLTFERKGSADVGRRIVVDSFPPLRGISFRTIEFRRADDTLALSDDNHFVRLDVLKGIDRAAGPANFEQVDFFCFPQAEVHAQIVLRDVAAAAADFVNLLVWFGFTRRIRDATQSRADAAAI